MATTQDLDATHILEAGHRKAEALFAQYEKASGPGAKQKIADDLCTELKVHFLIEEEIFYPALTGKIDGDALREAYVEHDAAKALVNEIVEGGPDDKFYDAKMTVLQEEIAHHIKEEEKERGNMFQQARATDVDLESLGAAMLQRKKALMAQAEAGELASAKPITMDESYK